MNTWTVFFLVVSVVVLTAPWLSVLNTEDRGVEDGWQDQKYRERDPDPIPEHTAAPGSGPGPWEGPGTPGTPSARRDNGDLSES